MAKTEWVSNDAENEIIFLLGNLPQGYISRKLSGSYSAVVYPGGGGQSLEISNNVTEAEAKAAVEEYWADKPVPTWAATARLSVLPGRMLGSQNPLS